MKGSFSDRKGFTITELLLASLFSLIVMGTLYGFYRDQLFQLLYQETKTATLEDARGALDIMARELRNAGSWATGTAPAGCSRIVTATPTEINVQADLNGDGDCDGDLTPDETGEDVTYTLFTESAACSTIRRSASASSSGEALVGECSTNPNVNVITLTGSLFTYYDSNGIQLAASPPVDDIKRIKITFSVRETNPDPRTRSSNAYVTSTLSSSVLLRN